MKAVIVYYSLEGNTSYVADKLASTIGAETIRLEPEKETPKGSFGKYFWGGKSVIFGEHPKLKPYQFKAEDYDLIIIGTPIWAGSFVPPFKTFFRDNDLSNKKMAIFACSAGGNAEKCFEKIKTSIPNLDVLATLSLIDPKAKPSKENDEKIKDFVNKLSKA